MCHEGGTAGGASVPVVPWLLGGGMNNGKYVWYRVQQLAHQRGHSRVCRYYSQFRPLVLPDIYNISSKLAHKEDCYSRAIAAVIHPGVPFFPV